MKILALAFVVALTGCATSKNVTLGQASGIRPIAKVAMSTEDGNSTAMDANFRDALIAQGVAPAGAVPRGARTSSEADAVLSYVDVWRWDLVMYLKSIDVHMFDAQSGNLLVTGRWEDSPLHGFRDAKEIVRDLVADMFTKVKPGSAQQARSN